MTTDNARPSLGALHHVAITVSDVDASADWYERLFALQRVPAPFPHHGNESPGYAILLVEPAAGWAIGIHHHDRYQKETADEGRTGLDHVGLSVPERGNLDEWAARLDAFGIGHSGVVDMQEPIPYSALVFRDPDLIQLEFVHLPG